VGRAPFAAATLDRHGDRCTHVCRQPRAGVSNGVGTGGHLPRPTANLHDVGDVLFVLRRIRSNHNTIGPFRASPTTGLRAASVHWENASCTGSGDVLSFTYID
jgi:hypothetical protein